MTPFLISNLGVGYDQERAPWLTPDDAFDSLLDGYVYRGVLNKRPGYNQLAIGGKTGASYCESRMVHRVTGAAMAGAINGANKIFTLAATAPIRRGTFVVTGSNPAQTATDNGLGGFTGNIDIAGVNAINYTTGAVTITLAAAPAGGSTVLATYDYHPGLPVMMIANFYTATGTKQLVCADTKYINRLNTTTNRLDNVVCLDDHGVAIANFTGDESNFWTWCNCVPAAGTPRLLMTNNVDVIQSYDGINVATYASTFSGAAHFYKCRHLFHYRDRVVMLDVEDGGNRWPRRIQCGGTGAMIDEFDETLAPGAGVIDIPDDSYITSASYNRDDLIIHTSLSTWILKYTGSDIIPFSLDKLDHSRGSDAPYGANTYLNKTKVPSTRGMIVSDGYRVERYDEKIPDYSFKQIDQDHYEQCFAGVVDEDRDIYLLHPSMGQTVSDRILVNNFEEENFAVYRIALSCMGNYIESYDVTWADLGGYATWAELAAVYPKWSSFAGQKGNPFAVGGGHQGQLWRLNVAGAEDAPVRIRAATVIDANTLQIETDWNVYAKDDIIYLDGMLGMTQANKKQAGITSIVTPGRVFRLNIPTTGFTAWTANGEASRVIDFDCTTKQFNPYAGQAAKVRCGYMYFYVDTSTTFLMTDDAKDACFLEVGVVLNDCGPDVTDLQDASGNAIAKPYRVNCSLNTSDLGAKRWKKIFINQTGRFIQFRLRNQQAGAQIGVHAIEPAMQPVGRLI